MALTFSGRECLPGGFGNASGDFRPVLWMHRVGPECGEASTEDVPPGRLSRAMRARTPERELSSHDALIGLIGELGLGLYQLKNTERATTRLPCPAARATAAARGLPLRQIVQNAGSLRLAQEVAEAFPETAEPRVRQRRLPRFEARAGPRLAAAVPLPSFVLSRRI